LQFDFNYSTILNILAEGRFLCH